MRGWDAFLGYFSVPRGQTHNVFHLGEWNVFSLKLWVEDDGLFWCYLPPYPNCNSVIFMLLRGFTDLFQRSQGRYPRVVLQVCVQLAIGCISVGKKTVECDPLLLSVLIYDLLGAYKAANFKACHYIYWGKKQKTWISNLWFFPVSTDSESQLQRE